MHPDEGQLRIAEACTDPTSCLFPVISHLKTESVIFGKDMNEKAVMKAIFFIQIKVQNMKYGLIRPSIIWL